MTTCDDVTAAPCSCDSCTADLPVNPFVALRVAYGMLLGEDDFRTMMGNPRGKHMLHNAWLHGSGVAWGYDIAIAGDRVLKVCPGLAVDGLGRELLLETTWSTDVRDWVVEQEPTQQAEGCINHTVHACLVARFGCCPTDPVPTLADPCDVTRKHDDFSRIVETAEIVLLPQECPSRPRPYHRVRVLLGLDEVGEPDPAGKEALEAVELVAHSSTDDRPRELLRQFRRLAALDVVDLQPATETGDASLTFFPVAEDHAAVVLARVEIDVREETGCTEITDVRLDVSCRTTLLPTATIQDLVCGLAPGLIGAESNRDAGGPRVIPESIKWTPDGRVLSFAVTAPLNAGSLRRAVRLTSLSERGWVDEDIDAVRYDPAVPAVLVEMADRPINELVRLIVSGTGPTPVFGANPPVPLAGVVGGASGTKNDGHDAVLTFPNPITFPNPTENRGTEA